MPRRMPIDQERIRALAVALPEAQEALQLGRPTFRVKGKKFLSLPEDIGSVHLRTNAERLGQLIASDPETYKDVWGGRWVGVDLARVSPDRLLDLIFDAWRQAAPKRLASKPLGLKFS